VTPPPIAAGGRVAVVSPSWAGPGVFPEVHETALATLRDELGLEPVEYPTTRRVGASARDRARDLMAAFADPSIGAVMASIGGDDQLTVLAHLDPDVLRAHPKRFFGYSDNTNLLNYLWNLGIVGYHGGSTMVHLARPGGTHRVTLDSLRHALFTNDTVDVGPVDRFTDLHADWNEESTLREELATTAEAGWRWRHAERVVSGPTWGGNLEILHWNLAANRWLRPVEDYAGCVLLLETSEDMPPAHEVYWMLRNFGERGLLEQFPAVVVAKPKAWSREHPLDEAAREQFRADQRDAVERALDEYNPGAIAVFGPDFGHTDPQLVLPYGGVMVVDGPDRRLTVTY
jgi:muramoyltetrapeptide carboxypeptidase LdcA involved in peptidoglycan recycling